MARPNVLLILTDQLRYPPPYESEELAAWRRRFTPGHERLRENGVSFVRHYAMSAACAPSRASLLTGHYPSLHGVTQTDGIAKSADGDEMTWLDADGIPTVGDWFRAGGYRTFYKGKWHVSHAHLPARDGEGDEQTITPDGTPIPDAIDRYLEADLLDPWGFSEWVGPEPHGLGKENTGTVKDPFTADETIALLERLGAEEDGAPWLAVSSFLNPHDIALFGIVGIPSGLRYRSRGIPSVAAAPTRDEDLSTKPGCQQSMVDGWTTMYAPQPWIETQRKFYYQLQARIDAQISRVLDALEASGAAEDTIVVFSSDHGDMLGAHGGMHQKWHNAYDESIRVPFVVSSPLFPGGSRELDVPTNHADLIPTLLGLAGIDDDRTLSELRESHPQARPLVGRDLSEAIRAADAPVPAAPVLFTTDDEISEGTMRPASPFQRVARKVGMYAEIAQPNHVETVVAHVDVDGEPHLVKFSRYHDNPQFWTVPGVRDERLRGRRTVTVTEPEADEFELYDLTVDPFEERNLAHPRYADEGSRALQRTMTDLLLEQLAAKRLTPASGERPGYRAPVPA